MKALPVEIHKSLRMLDSQHIPKINHCPLVSYNFRRKKKTMRIKIDWGANKFNHKQN